MDRVSYLLQEIYGIENKNNQETKVKKMILFSQTFFFFFDFGLGDMTLILICDASNVNSILKYLFFCRNSLVNE